MKARAWNTIDLRGFNIDIPDGGFYLALEYLGGGGGPNRIVYLDKLPNCGNILQPFFAEKECRIWVQGPGHWDYSKGKRGEYIFAAWVNKSISCEEFKIFGNAIKIEVECTE